MGVGTFNGNANYKIDVDAAVERQSGMVSTIYWRVYVIKNNTTGHAAWGSTGSSGWVDSNLGAFKDLWNNGNMEYNFQNGSMSGTFMIAEGYFDITHRSDGNQEYFVNAGLTLINLGYAEAGTGTRSLPRIQTAGVPAAPTPVGFGPSTMTSIQYKFVGNSNGGSDIIEWQALIRDETVNGPQISYASNGSTTRKGLIPGHLYSFWSRGRNAIGWGPWSYKTSTYAISPANTKVNGVWKNANPYVKYNDTWRLAQPWVKVNGVWKKGN